MVELIDLVKQGMELATAGDREDLHERLKQTHDRLLDPMPDGRWRARARG